MTSTQDNTLYMVSNLKGNIAHLGDIITHQERKIVDLMETIKDQDSRLEAATKALENLTRTVADLKGQLPKRDRPLGLKGALDWLL